MGNKGQSKRGMFILLLICAVVGVVTDKTVIAPFLGIKSGGIGIGVGFFITLFLIMAFVLGRFFKNKE